MQTLLLYLADLGPWNWLILAVVLFLLEAVVPGVHFMWFGTAAIVMAGLVALTGWTWPVQLVVYALLSIATVVAMRRLWRPDATETAEPKLNLRGEQYVGRTVVVAEAIVRGRGKVRVGDTLWQAEGPDSAIGANVTVTGARGNVLVVAPALP